MSDEQSTTPTANEHDGAAKHDGGAAGGRGATPPAERVGVIGIGTMGGPMASHLVEAGTPVTVWARSTAATAELEKRGTAVASSPRELAEHADIVVSVLPDLPQLIENLEGDDGLLAGIGDRAKRPLLIVVSSTSSPDGVRELDARLRDETAGRVRVIDAPVSGGEDGAKAGTLSIMVGGEDASAERVIAALRPCGTPVHLGPLGAGEVAKACNQLIVAATITAIGEASVLAERSGIDLAVLFDLLAGGYAGSRVLDSRKQRFVEHDHSPSGVAKFMVKDLTFATQAAADTSTNPALLPELLSIFTDLVDRGFGDNDISVTQAYTGQR